MQHVLIKGNSINECWFRAIKACVKYGSEYTIDKGEYEGQKRKEFDFVTIHIQKPWIRPLACQSPKITPTTDEKIEQYFRDYIMNPYFSNEEEEKNNEYKYSSWIAPNWENCCNLLSIGDGGTNQATISIGYMPDKQYTHPACLRILDFRIRFNMLHLIIYFRSNDLIAAFPENIGGLQLFKEWCLEYINDKRILNGYNRIEDGMIIYSSKGLHIYQHFFELATDFSGNNDITSDMQIYLL